MSDLIDRQAAIDAVLRAEALVRVYGYRYAADAVRELPSAQPETHDKRTETHACDLISRQDAIDALGEEPEVWTGRDEYAQGLNNQWHYDVNALKAVPSAQPEIIRCSQCKYAEVADPEDSQDGYTCQFHRGSIWFSGSYCSWAERREE